MPSLYRSHYFEKPETLEMISLTAEVWKDEEGNERSYSFLWRRGCCLSPEFDKEEFARFTTRDELEKHYDAVYNEYRNKEFKTRDELGMKPIGVSHDEIVLNFRRQIIEQYLKALVAKLGVPPND